MAMSVNKMSDEILTLVRANMKKVNSDAREMPFQETYSKAVATGVIKTIKKAKTTGSGGGASGVGIGLILDPDLMLDAAKLYALSKFPGGSATEPFLEAFFVAISTHLAANTFVVSVNGKGGQGGPPVGTSPELFKKNILSSFPKEAQKNIKRAPAGEDMLMAICTGLDTGMKAGIPGAIPASGDSAGMVATFK